ncbi:hypothetical protein [Glycomyces tenuis]|uniref:hypothetical protein n=1 Tax=Glycomyces tenuis TaxID=58116 RepID=UPI000418FAAC|nr:hypothetical protein [Glycomyces tenuis]
MSTLITEAERRFLGAMLADRTIDPGDHITAADFSNPAYGAVYSAIGSTRASTYLEGPELSAQVARLVDAPGIDQPTLEMMRAAAPDNRDHIAAYGRMITEASSMRQLRDLALDSLHSDRELTTEHQREFQVMDRISQTGLELLDRPYILEADSEPSPEAGTRIRHEEQLVAALLANPEQVRTLVEIAPPETLDDFRCRTAYEYIAATAWDRDPVSDLDLLYQLGKAENLLVNSGQERLAYPEPDAAFLQRLHQTPTSPHTGTEAARAIAAENARIKPEQCGPSPYTPDLSLSPTIDLGSQPHQSGPQPGIEGGAR